MGEWLKDELIPEYKYLRFLLRNLLMLMDDGKRETRAYKIFKQDDNIITRFVMTSQRMDWREE